MRGLRPRIPPAQRIVMSGRVAEEIRHEVEVAMYNVCYNNVGPYMGVSFDESISFKA